MIPKLERLLRNSLGDSWFGVLRSEFEKQYFLNLLQVISKERKGWTVYPETDRVFTAFRLAPFSMSLKAVIVGQEPYHDGAATGIAFGTSQNNPSIQKIMRQLQFYEEFGEIEMNPSREPSFRYLAEQGILLLNRVLTVRRKRPRSHYNIGWEQFTLQVLNLIPKEVPILLWGRKAGEGFKNSKGNLVIKCEHPAAACYERRAWHDNRCFGKVNEYLVKTNRKIILW